MKRTAIALSLGLAAGLPTVALAQAGHDTHHPAQTQEQAAAPAALPKLDANNPTAKALAYSENAATVKHPKHKAGDHCANCNFFKAPAGQAYGPCTLFPKNSVAAKGWCSAWAKKP